MDELLDDVVSSGVTKLFDTNPKQYSRLRLPKPIGRTRRSTPAWMELQHGAANGDTMQRMEASRHKSRRPDRIPGRRVTQYGTNPKGDTVTQTLELRASLQRPGCAALFAQVKQAQRIVEKLAGNKACCGPAERCAIAPGGLLRACVAAGGSKDY